MGNGDIPDEFVISGTAVRPRSDEVWMRIVSIDLVRVVARELWNACRSEGCGQSVG